MCVVYVIKLYIYIYALYILKFQINRIGDTKGTVIKDFIDFLQKQVCFEFVYWHFLPPYGESKYPTSVA